QPVRTITATIAAEMGETVQGGLHFSALFAIGLVLFLITFLINLIAERFMGKIRNS
ncbi:MAG: phosphate ABC transporter permease subunit PstC, partial [Actinobacteria bacterium]|nr:phosphate ABC transporter permease subunit PstC [Actinomycetota bacterium]